MPGERQTSTIATPQHHDGYRATATGAGGSRASLVARMVGRATAFIAAVTALLTLTIASSAFEQAAADWSRYQPSTIASLVIQYPAQRSTTISPDIPLRLRVRYSAEFRELSEDGRRLLATWGQAMSVSGLQQAFRREIKVYEAGVEYWLIVQERLVPDMKAELRRDEEFEVYAIYVGQVDGRHILLINGHGR